MRAPTRRWRGLTWVGWLNYLVLSYTVSPADAIGTFMTAAAKGETVAIDFNQPPTRWFLTRWVWPVPWTPYKHVGRARGKTRPA